MPKNDLENDLKGILLGTDRIIDKQLGNHKHGSVGLALTEAPHNFSSKKLLEEMIIQIEKNLNEARHPSSGIVLGKSIENWREKPPAQKHDKRKPERDLEHKLVGAGEEDPDWRWWNQMPIASGLVGHRKDRTRAIDLVCQRKKNPAHYRFIELKIGRESGAPLAAMMEILRYGLVCFTLRKNRGQKWLDDILFDSPIFKANCIDLRVLAPESYYKNYQLGWLETSLTSALNKIVKDQLDESLTMNLSSYWPTHLKTISGLDNSKLKSYLTEWTDAYPK